MSVETSTTTKPALTEGQRRVRLTFNPNEDADVKEVKEMGAALVDKLDELRQRILTSEAAAKKGGEWTNATGREFATAKTEVENAMHWVIKAVTSKFMD